MPHKGTLFFCAFSFHQVILSIRQINLKAVLRRISFEPEIKKTTKR